jgi:hypothetical protein
MNTEQDLLHHLDDNPEDHRQNQTPHDGGKTEFLLLDENQDENHNFPKPEEPIAKQKKEKVNRNSQEALQKTIQTLKEKTDTSHLNELMSHEEIASGVRETFQAVLVLLGKDDVVDANIKKQVLKDNFKDRVTGLNIDDIKQERIIKVEEIVKGVSLDGNAKSSSLMAANKYLKWVRAVVNVWKETHN